VWNREYKQFFVDTIIKNYPVPPIFINVEVQSDGSSVYHVVDGKQRLLSILEFLEDKIPVASLAKRFEDVYVPGFSNPVEIPRGSDALFMLQVIRDEAHRFANSFHRQLRGKKMRSGLLDNIAGLGAARSKKLSAVLGGIAGIKAASRDDLRLLTWLPETVADAVFERCHVQGAATI